MHAVGQDLRTLQAVVSLTEVSGTLGDDALTRVGTLHLAKDRPEDGPRLRVAFDRKRQNNRTTAERIEYLLQGDWLIDRTYDRRIEVRRQVRRPDQPRVDLLTLDGPVPLPIGQPPEQVLARFDVSPLDASDAAAGLQGLRLVPRPDTRLARQFRYVDVWVDPADGMPKRIESVDDAGTFKTTELRDVRLNTPLPANAFVLEPVGRDWQVTEQPL